MSLAAPAAMVLFYDIEGDTADHDDWHSREHFHERLSIPGFLRATRWIARDAGPRYLVTYEIESVGMATSPAYLDRLDNPSAWTREMMPRFRGMRRGFHSVAASAGYGLGAAAVAVRFTPADGEANRLSGWLAETVIPALVSSRGMVGATLLQPAPPAPMTREQALRGRDAVTPWLVLVTAYDAAALRQSVAAHLDPGVLKGMGAAGEIATGEYALHSTASRADVSRMPGPLSRRSVLGG